MIRRFCDVCNKELTDKNSVFGAPGRPRRLCNESLPGVDTEVMFEVTTGYKGAWGRGDFCKYCVIDAINKLDDRPRAYPG